MPNLIFVFPKSNNSTLNGINIKKLRKSGLTELVNKDRKLLFKKLLENRLTICNIDDPKEKENCEDDNKNLILKLED